MTVAVCFKCGTIKFGAMLPCPSCRARPASDDDLVISVALTDHHYPRSELERIGQEMASGKAVVLDPSFVSELRTGLREAKALAPGLAAITGTPQSAKAAPWWKFWRRKTADPSPTTEERRYSFPELGAEDVSLDTCKKLLAATERELAVRSVESKEHPWYRDCARRIREGAPYFVATMQEDGRLVFDINAAERITRCVAYWAKGGRLDLWFIDEHGKPVLGQDEGNKGKAVRPPQGAYAGGKRVVLGDSNCERSALRPLAEPGEPRLPIYDQSLERRMQVSLDSVEAGTALRLFDEWQTPLGMAVVTTDGSPILLTTDGRLIIPARQIN